MAEQVYINQDSKHDVLLYSRRNLTLTGISSVDFYDENSICATTSEGEILVAQGTGITLSDVSLDSGTVTAQGEFNAVYYEEQQAKKSGFFKRLFSGR